MGDSLAGNCPVALVFWCEWVDLACRWLRSRLQFDGMVPEAFLWQQIKGFLGEDLFEVTQVVWDEVCLLC